MRTHSASTTRASCSTTTRTSSCPTRHAAVRSQQGRDREQRLLRVDMCDIRDGDGRAASAGQDGRLRREARRAGRVQGRGREPGARVGRPRHGESDVWLGRRRPARAARTARQWQFPRELAHGLELQERESPDRCALLSLGTLSTKRELTERARAAFVSEPAQYRFPYTKDTYNNPENLWTFVYAQGFFFFLVCSDELVTQTAFTVPRMSSTLDR